MFPVKIIQPFKQCGSFGVVRRHDIHTGLDFYCEEGGDVACIREGVVIDVFQFTGVDVGTHWWNSTDAVVVECGNLIYVYGEVNPSVRIGQRLAVGDHVGNVARVLRTYKGATPTSMLHLEVWEKAHYKKNFTWALGDEKPVGLFDPKEVLIFWLIKTEHGYMLEDRQGRLVKWFDMACNSKAYCMELGIEPVYLTPKCRLADRQAYNALTGKRLWWEGTDGRLGR